MEFIVTRDQGYPIDNPAYKQGTVVELDAKVHAAAVSAGYLVPADPDDKRFTEDMARAVAAFRIAKAEGEKAAAALKTAEEREAKDAADAARKRAEETKRNTPPPDTRKETVTAILAATVQPTVETRPNDGDAGVKVGEFESAPGANELTDETVETTIAPSRPRR